MRRGRYLIGWIFILAIAALNTSKDWAEGFDVPGTPVQTDKALILLRSEDAQSYHQAIQTIQDNGGDVTQGFYPSALIATTGPKVEAALQTDPVVALVTKQTVDPAAAEPLGDSATAAAMVWNTIHVGDPPAAPVFPEPWREERPPYETELTADAGVASGLPGSFAPTEQETSEFMAGSVLVDVVFFESTGVQGSCPPPYTSTEDWTSPRVLEVLSVVGQGLDFWTTRENRPGLSFTMNYDAVPTSCEPIDHPYPDMRYWVTDMELHFGCDTTAATDDQTIGQFVRKCANKRREELGFDWAFFIGIINTTNDISEDPPIDPDDPNLPGLFADGGTGEFAGPYVQLRSERGGRQWFVVAHEVGHVFGPGEEYEGDPVGDPGNYPACHAADRHGYLRVPNTSCDYDGIDTDKSIMSGEPYWDDPDVDVSESARGAVGWRNPLVEQWSTSTIVDVVRTSAVTLDPFSPDPTTQHQPTYNLVGYNVPFPPGVGYPDTDGVSISGVKTARWQVDGGSFAGAQATDGTYGEETEDAYFSPSSPLPDGIHIFGVASINTFGHGSQLATDTLAISADSDGDGCADVYELGPDKTHGGQRDPFNPWDWWDIYPIPNPENPPPYGGGDGEIDVFDTQTIAFRVGNLSPGHPLYRQRYDRSANPSITKDWDTNGPSGEITEADFYLIVKTFSDSCP
jgi:hypothetical protein